MKDIIWDATWGLLLAVAVLGFIIAGYNLGHLSGYRQAQQEAATTISLEFVPPEINRAYPHKYPNPRLQDKSNG